MVVIWAQSTHWGWNGIPDTLWSPQNMFQMAIITISQYLDITIIGEIADLMSGYHPPIIDIGWCDLFFPLTRIHKKLGVTLFGRGGERRRVLLIGEVRELHIYIYISMFTIRVLFFWLPYFFFQWKKNFWVVKKKVYVLSETQILNYQQDF